MAKKEPEFSIFRASKGPRKSRIGISWRPLAYLALLAFVALCAGFWLHVQADKQDRLQHLPQLVTPTKTVNLEEHAHKLIKRPGIKTN